MVAPRPNSKKKPALKCLGTEETAASESCSIETSEIQHASTLQNPSDPDAEGPKAVVRRENRSKAFRRRGDGGPRVPLPSGKRRSRNVPAWKVMRPPRGNQAERSCPQTTPFLRRFGEEDLANSTGVHGNARPGLVPLERVNYRARTANLSIRHPWRFGAAECG